jgi:hypothetical protein
MWLEFELEHPNENKAKEQRAGSPNFGIDIHHQLIVTLKLPINYVDVLLQSILYKNEGFAAFFGMKAYLALNPSILFQRLSFPLQKRRRPVLYLQNELG